VKCNEIAKEFGVAGLARRRRFLAIDPRLDINGALLRVLPAEECLIDIFPFSSDLDFQEPDFSRMRVATRVQAAKSWKKRRGMA
jgi:hypothetical protein